MFCNLLYRGVVHIGKVRTFLVEHNVISGSFLSVVKIVISSVTLEGRDFSSDARNIWEPEYPCSQWDLGI